MTTPTAREALLANFPEINFSNYDQDCVEKLQAWAFEAYDALSATPPSASTDAGDTPAPQAVTDTAQEGEVGRLRGALRDLLPYAQATIGLPESSWPADSVILKARSLLPEFGNGK